LSELRHAHEGFALQDEVSDVWVLFVVFGFLLSVSPAEAGFPVQNATET
jgi:hypothetical protein